MNKHTPGPWFVDHKSPFLVRAGDDIDGRHIAHIGPANYTPRFDVDEPNAKLIAAAPDLLEAAQLALQIAESWIHDQLDGTSSIDGALLHLDPVRAAIARARGDV